MQLIRILRSRLLVHVAYLTYRTAIKLCYISARLRDFGDRAYRAGIADYANRQHGGVVIDPRPTIGQSLIALEPTNDVAKVILLKACDSRPRQIAGERFKPAWFAPRVCKLKEPVPCFRFTKWGGTSH